MSVVPTTDFVAYQTDTDTKCGVVRIGVRARQPIVAMDIQS